MSITSWRPRTIGVLAAAGLFAAASLLAAPTAQAAPAPVQAARTGTVAALADVAAKRTDALATSLSAQLGSKTAGSYLDSRGQLVVTITDRGVAAAVTAAGAVPRVVAHSAATLASAAGALNAGARIAGTAWAVDPVTNQVVVSTDSTVTGAKLARLKTVVARLGSAVRLESAPGVLRPTIAGGDAIYTGGARCSLGFNVQRGSTQYFITAGHCTNIGSTWTNSSGTRLGTRVGTSFPGNDYGIVQYTGTTSRPGVVDLHNGTTQDISSAGNAVVGQSAARSGSTSGYHTGRVTAVNATVNYSEGTVYGLIRTTICAEPGDSGGSMFAGSIALGTTSGGSGDCSSGGVTFFQPVPEVLSAYGVQVY